MYYGSGTVELAGCRRTLQQKCRVDAACALTRVKLRHGHRLLCVTSYKNSDSVY